MYKYIVAFILFSNLSSAQLFHKQIYNNDHMRGREVNIYNNNIYMSGWYHDEGGNDVGVLMKFDMDMNLIDSLSYKGSQAIRLHSSCFTDNFIFTGQHLFSGTDVYWGITRLTHDLSIGFDKAYGKANTLHQQVRALAIHNDLIYVGGDWGNSGASILCLDQTGATKWTKTLPYGNQASVEEFIFLEDRILAFGVEGNESRWSSFLLIYDYDGNFIGSKFYSGFNKFFNLAGAKIIDDGIFTSGFTSFKNKTHLVVDCHDLDGNIKWSNYYDIGDENRSTDFLRNLSDMEIVNDHIIIAGEIEFGSGNYQSFFIKLDREGNIVKDIVTDLKDDGPHMVRSIIHQDGLIYYLMSHNVYIAIGALGTDLNMCSDHNELNAVKIANNDYDYSLNDGIPRTIIEDLNYDISFDYETNFEIRNTCISSPSSTGCDVSFDYPNFAEVTNLSWVGSAKVFEDNARITEAQPYQAGALWHTDPVPISHGFTTEFEYKPTFGRHGGIEEDYAPGADGITLVIQGRTNRNIGDPGGGLGYQGIPHSVAIELDMFHNREYGDPDGQHIAVQSVPFDDNSAVHNDINTVAMIENVRDLKADGSETYFVKVEYLDKILKVYLNTEPEYIDPVLNIPDFHFEDYLDLLENNEAFVGFTSATGDAVQTNEVLSWNYCGYTPANVKDDQETNSNIYPNPSMGLIIIDTDMVFNKVEVYNITGSMVLEIETSTKMIDLNSMKNGSYFIRVYNDDILLDTQSLIINR